MSWSSSSSSSASSSESSLSTDCDLDVLASEPLVWCWRGYLRGLPTGRLPSRGMDGFGGTVAISELGSPVQIETKTAWLYLFLTRLCEVVPGRAWDPGGVWGWPIRDTCEADLVFSFRRFLGFAGSPLASDALSITVQRRGPARPLGHRSRARTTFASWAAWFWSTAVEGRSKTRGGEKQGQCRLASSQKTGDAAREECSEGERW